MENFFDENLESILSTRGLLLYTPNRDFYKHSRHFCAILCANFARFVTRKIDYYKLTTYKLHSMIVTADGLLPTFRGYVVIHIHATHYQRDNFPFYTARTTRFLCQ